jgi:hypothetical protein
MTPRDPEKSVEDIAKELFAPPGKGASINLPGHSTAKNSKRKAKTKDKRDDHKLPDDMHFSSKQLITLFLKPKFAVRIRFVHVFSAVIERDNNSYNSSRCAVTDCKVMMLSMERLMRSSGLKRRRPRQMETEMKTKVKSLCFHTIISTHFSLYSS